METKRCSRCHKLLRVDAQACSRCGGNDFLSASQTRTRHPGSLLTSDTASTPSKSDLPARSPSLLSPHRAGHYSGLHPEDQPYQSSFLPVQRPALSAQPALEVEEVEDLTYSTLPDVSIAPATVAPPKRQVAAFTPLPMPRQQRSTQTYRAPRIEQDETERDLEATHAPVSAPTIVAPRPLALATRPPRHRRPGSVVSLLLILSCFLFIVATSILAFLVLNSKPAPPLKPQLQAEQTDRLRVHDSFLLTGSGFEPNASLKFIRDANVVVLDTHGNPLQARTFSTGNFFVSVTIGDSWNSGKHTLFAIDQQGNRASASITVQATPPGAPQLRLASSHIDLGEDNIGVVSHKNVILLNGGGGDVNWQGSSYSSDSSWLSLTPNNGSFSGSQQIVITVNRSNLAAKAYTGHISFTLQGSSGPAQVLTVTMGVNAAPVNPASANLVLSNATFTFTGDSVTNPAIQTLTMQNTGGQSLNWTASAATTSGGNWLTLSSNSGYLGAGAVATLAVSATSAGLGVGAYQGTLTMSYAGATATPIAVTLTVNPPPVAKVAISSGGLSFHAIMGQNPPAQSFTITNDGNAPLNWGILEDANAKTYALVSQASGALAPSKSITITITPSIAQANAGTLNGTITVLDTDAATPVKSQQVRVTFSIVNQAVISLDQNQLIYNHTGAIPNSSQLITLTNAGSAPLNWSVTISNSSPIAWLTVDNTGSAGVNPGGAEFLNVTCDSTNLSPGTFSATLTIRDTDAGSPVAPQVITVTVVVS